MGNQAFEASSFLHGVNSAFIEKLYEKYLAHPESLDSSWQRFFDDLGDEAESVIAEVRGASWAPPLRQDESANDLFEGDNEEVIYATAARAPYALGASSAAQVRQLRSTNNLTQLIKYSTELYGSLEEETGQATGWTRTGSLSIATNPDRLIHIKRQAALARLFGVEAQIIGPSEAAEMWPMMRSDDVVGAVDPGDECFDGGIQ